MDMLVEIVSLLGPPDLADLEKMNIEIEKNYDVEDGKDHNDLENTGYSSLVQLMLSIRTFKTFEERLRDKLERTSSGRFNVLSKIVDLIINSLQYVAIDRTKSVPTFQNERSIEL